MKNILFSRRIIQGIFLLLVILNACDDSYSVKQKIDRKQLEIVVERNEDFKAFIKLHYHNRAVVASLTNDQSEEIRKLYQSLENNFDVQRAKLFLQKIEFENSALIELSSTKKFLDNTYIYDQEDLVHIIAKFLNTYAQGSKLQQAAMDCDTYCSIRAEEKYPDVEDDPGATMWNRTARAIYYAGCMDGCQHAD